MSIDKKFTGDLDAVSKGTMLALMTSVKGSAGYVAMERVEGTLDGRAGSFVLQHAGTMNRGAPEQSVTVVPDSGTGELTGPPDPGCESGAVHPRKFFSSHAFPSEKDGP